MSFHGGLIGATIALYIFAIRNKRPVLPIYDDMARIAPAGLFFGRMGNYLNHELLGFAYT